MFVSQGRTSAVAMGYSEIYIQQLTPESVVNSTKQISE